MAQRGSGLSVSLKAGVIEMSEWPPELMEGRKQLRVYYFRVLFHFCFKINIQNQLFLTLMVNGVS